MEQGLGAGGMDEMCLVLFSLMLACGQVLFKVAARGAGVAAIVGSPALWGALLLYAGSTVLWVWILTRVPLARAYPWSALGAVLVPLLAVLVLGEAVRPLFWVGAALIGLGVVLTQLGSGA